MQSVDAKIVEYETFLKEASHSINDIKDQVLGDIVAKKMNLTCI